MKGPGAILLIGVGIVLLWLAFSGQFEAIWTAVQTVTGGGVPGVVPPGSTHDCAELDESGKCEGKDFEKRTIGGREFCCLKKKSPGGTREGPGLPPEQRERMGCVRAGGDSDDASWSCGPAHMKVEDAQGRWCCPASGGGEGVYGYDSRPSGGIGLRYLPNVR